MHTLYLCQKFSLHPPRHPRLQHTQTYKVSSSLDLIPSLPLQKFHKKWNHIFVSNAAKEQTEAIVDGKHNDTGRVQQYSRFKISATKHYKPLRLFTRWISTFGLSWFWNYSGGVHIKDIFGPHLVEKNSNDENNINLQVWLGLFQIGWIIIDESGDHGAVFWDVCAS